MIALRNIDYLTDKQGNKKSVVLKVTDFEKLQEEIEDLEDTLELEKAKKMQLALKNGKNSLRM